MLIEVSRAETDQYRYDLVLTAGTVTRHVQVKASIKGGRTAKQTVHVSLATKPSPCVVWIVVRDDPDRLATDHYVFFGGRPGQRMPDLGHARGKNPWTGAARDRTRLIEKSKFHRIDSVDALLVALFGSEADSNGQASD